MVWNYFKTAIRNLTKRKFVSIINLTGLSVSLALFMMIGLYIQFETSYDSFHEKSKDIYLLTKEIKTPTSYSLRGSVNYPEGPLIAEDFPQVNQVVRFYKSDNSLSKSGDKVFIENNFFFVDKNVFEVFDFEVILGSAEDAFSEVHNIMITEETALRYFGKIDALGEVITVTEQYWNATNDFKVVGILKAPPLNSHIQFDFLTSFDAFEHLTQLKTSQQNPMWYWGWNTFSAYVELNPEADKEELEASFDGFINKYYPERSREYAKLSLTPIEDVYLRSDINNGQGIVGNPKTIKVLSGVALFILIIACINFVNLTTARSSLYAREIGVKKVLGARRSQLFFQLILESVLLTFFAIVLAVVAVEIFLPFFQNAVGKVIEIDIFSLSTLTRLFGVGLVIGVLSGFYPSIVLSGFKPLTALRGERVQSEGKISVRKILVVFQFTVSIVLVLGSMVIYRQLVFISDKDLGFDQNELLYIEVPSGLTTRNSAQTVKYEAMQDRLRNLSRISGVTSNEDQPGVSVGNEFVIPDGKGDDEKIVIPFMWVDEYFFETFDIKLTQGELGKFENGAPIKYYLNESARNVFNWDDPIGKQIAIGSSRGAVRQGLVQGTVQDFNFESLYNSIKPMMIGVWPNHLSSGRWNLFIRANTKEYTAMIDEVEAIWNEYYPERPFNISFLDDTIQQQYQAQTNLLKILPYLTGFAVFIACLGLFGLASFVVERRTKEVGVRKVLGASIQQIVVLISSDFMKLLLVANLIAWPAAFFYLKDWLNNFNYSIPLSWSFFAFAGILVMAVALITVGLKVIKGARSNPVDSLRYE